MKELYNVIRVMGASFLYMALSHSIVVYTGSADWTAWVLLLGFWSLDSRIFEAINKKDRI